MKKSAIRLMTIAALAFMGMNVLAQTATWTGGGADNNWSTVGNWSPAEIPNGNSYTVVVETASASINVDDAYTINNMTIASNDVSNGSTVALNGTGVLTIDMNSGTTAGIRNLAVGTGSVLEFNCDVTIANSAGTGGGNRTAIAMGTGTNNVIRFGAGSTLTLNSQLQVSHDNGKVEFNCTLLGDAVMNIWRDNTYFGAGYDDSAYSSFFVTAGSCKMTLNGGTMTAGLRIQINSGTSTFVFNAPNVSSGINIRGNGASSGFNLVVNASQDNMGWLDVGGADSTIDPAGGTLAFADSSGQSWLSGSLTISTNFTAGDIRFGTTGTALNELQLLNISADGIAAGAALDADGYLVIEGPPPVITGEDIVDYNGGSDTNARPADVESDTGYTWNFSETEPLLTDPSTPNATIYGGVIGTWSVATNYVPRLELSNNQILAQVNPDNGSETALKGMYVWKKEDFLLGSDGTLSFTNGNSMTIGVRFFWGNTGTSAIRFMVKQGGTYYVSDAAITSGGNDQILFIDPSDPAVNWAPVSTNDYSIGSYGPMTFADVEAVGIALDILRNSSGINLTFNDFQVRATVELPPLTEISDVSSSLVGDQLILSWQGTNRASYAVQMREDLLFGDWSNVVTIAGEDDIMSVTNATDEPQAFFRTILVEE